jgi:hypothetical protein
MRDYGEAEMEKTMIIILKHNAFVYEDSITQHPKLLNNWEQGDGERVTHRRRRG